MAKKEQFDVTAVINTITEIEYDLILRLEINVSNNILIESDGKTLITLDNKPICYPKEAYNNFNVIKFDPFFNRKLANFLFQRYVYLYLREHPGVSIDAFFLATELTRPKDIFAKCRTSIGDIESNCFTNETVSWIDLLYKMDNCQYPYNEFLKLDQGINFIKSMEAL